MPKPKILIVVEGGVASVYSEGGEVDVAILDLDALEENPCPSLLPPSEFDDLCEEAVGMDVLRSMCCVE